MTLDIFRNTISRLESCDFARFVFELLSTAYGKDLRRYEGIEDSAFIREHYGYHDVYVFQNIPFELFRVPDQIDFKTPDFLRLVSRIASDYEHRMIIHGLVPAGEPVLDKVFFVNNLCGHTIDLYRKVLIPRYEAFLADFIPVQRPYVDIGNVDTFLELKAEVTIAVLASFLEKTRSGLSIELTAGRFDVRPYFSEKYLTSGVGRVSKAFCNPVFNSVSVERESVLREFEELLSRNPRENMIEKFIVRHYREVFGWHYDRIETQLWLRFPELDINAKSRRLDIFLRNSVNVDWDLFELKRLVPLTGTYRDSSTLSAEIYKAIQQVKNYDRILRQKFMKDKLGREGIEYFEPSLHLVVGRRPNISHDDWRWLVMTNSEHVKLLNWDEVLKEMRIRLRETSAFNRTPS